VKGLDTGTQVQLQKENSGPISIVAKEFWFERLLSECSAVQADF
jgi:hypothetical protein